MAKKAPAPKTEKKVDKKYGKAMPVVVPPAMPKKRGGKKSAC